MFPDIQVISTPNAEETLSKLFKKVQCRYHSIPEIHVKEKAKVALIFCYISETPLFNHEKSGKRDEWKIGVSMK